MMPQDQPPKAERNLTAAEVERIIDHQRRLSDAEGKLVRLIEEAADHLQRDRTQPEGKGPGPDSDA